ncbi:poly-beta-1,6 N-acetyl-D-glucosamine export porin PgaA [Stenotrophomonas sp. CFBP 13725]|uniref:poly-beta-1,6 N-acetyl-D-glucosamine export porin PgaA n=1 Tax=Stenotrophomonas sp. CFBP 13725 TaxID=2775297 RepID=UPI00178292E8|nr:poly-beta-1,6 N-acetyl-D-glucosamine export porin PgaA [Stenotrophomonas sp. CFBP 13725]MBD8636809.1 poly-beta-1,6 N-acetyl-D-glucosamine export porin PgaA [Stenotrophomonas sp. CFBP 13725]
MSFHRPLAHCVGLACLVLASGSQAATAPPRHAEQMAEISRHRDQAHWLDALAAIERAQASTPDDDLLYKLKVLTLGDIGNASRAWQLYQARPTLFDEGQKQRFEADYLARLVGWSLAYGESEDTRLDEAEDTLALMERYLQRGGTPLAQAPQRIRLDRLILLNRLSRHAQLREEYHALIADGIELPDYVLPAVGDSLMATQHPEEAIPVLERAVKNDPSRFQARSELAYAYLETEQATTAIDYLQRWQKEEPVWRWGPNARAPYANWARYEADLNLAMIRAYSNDLPTAQSELQQMVAIGPGNGGLQTALGGVYQMRGWPRRAMERHQMAYTLDPRDVSPRIGMFESHIALQRDDLARPLHDDLLARYPNQPSVQRMDRAWRAHRGWQLQANAEVGRSSGGGGASPLGNDDGSYRVQAASPIIADRWRVLAFADRRSVDFQDQRINPWWFGAGVNYRFDRLDGELTVVHPNDQLGDTGLRGGLGWQFSDQWHAGVSAARNDADASMQARVSGITADSVALTADYTRNERTQWSMGASQFRYDDGNRRDTVNTSVVQRLVSTPTVLVDGRGSLYASRGSRDDVPYFNPARDRSVEIGLRIDQQLWRHYEKHFRHRLTVSVGDYWQEGFGSALVPSAEYRHEWQIGAGRIFEYGVRWSRPVYDGQREQHVGLEAGLRWGE